MSEEEKKTAEAAKAAPEEKKPVVKEAPKEEKKAEESPEVLALRKENEELRKKLDETEAKYEAADKTADDWKNKYYGVYADMANTRKQVEKENADYKKYAQQKFIEELIPAMNAFDAVLKTTPDDPAVLKYHEGLEMTYGKLQSVMKQLDVTIIDPKKGEPFDPNTMQAFATTDGPADDLVADTCFKGYRLYDHLIRPACVLVTKKPPEAPKEAKKEETKAKDETKAEPKADEKKK
jgi:molecular chaperone GrpE